MTGSVVQLLRRAKQAIYHSLRLYPVYRVLRLINRRVALRGCSALEAFAYTGAWQARAYRHLPSYHEAWEIDPWCEPQLRRNLPKAVIRITNSFEEVKRCKRRFDFINVDTHQGLFGNYCENFEFFPLLFNVTADSCVVNLNVIPFAGPEWRKKYNTLFNEEHLRRRAEFYRTNTPENVSLETMLKRYGEIAAENGYRITWHHFIKRSLTYYLPLHLEKIR